MSTAYIALHLRSYQSSRPIITMYQTNNMNPRPDMSHWVLFSAPLPEPPHMMIDVHVGLVATDWLVDAKGLFWNKLTAERAAEESMLNLLSNKAHHQQRIHISWERSKRAGQTVYARTFERAKKWKDWWLVCEVEVVV